MDTTEEAQIRQLFEDWKAAFEARDVERVMSFYAPEIVAFDIMPPMQFAGEEAWRGNWVDFLGQFEDDPTLEIEDFRIHCSGDIAFVHGFTRLQGTMGGRPLDSWTRQTNCLRRVDGAWLIVHDHVSVPVDFSTGQALMDLEP